MRCSVCGGGEAQELYVGISFHRPDYIDSLCPLCAEWVSNCWFDIILTKTLMEDIHAELDNYYPKGIDYNAARIVVDFVLFNAHWSGNTPLLLRSSIRPYEPDPNFTEITFYRY